MPPSNGVRRAQTLPHAGSQGPGAACFRCDRACEIVRVVAIYKGSVDTEFAEVHIELRVRATVQRTCSNNFIAGFAYVEHCNHLRRHATAGCYGGATILQRRDTFLEYRYRWIRQPRIHIAEGL